MTKMAKLFYTPHICTVVSLSHWMKNCPFTAIFLTAMALKGIDYEYKAVSLIKDGGEQVMYGACSSST